MYLKGIISYFTYNQKRNILHKKNGYMENGKSWEAHNKLK